MDAAIHAPLETTSGGPSAKLVGAVALGAAIVVALTVLTFSLVGPAPDRSGTGPPKIHAGTSIQDTHFQVGYRLR
jgi:hypothetical protein